MGVGVIVDMDGGLGVHVRVARCRLRGGQG